MFALVLNTESYESLSDEIFGGYYTEYEFFGKYTK